MTASGVLLKLHRCRSLYSLGCVCKYTCICMNVGLETGFNHLRTNEPYALKAEQKCVTEYVIISRLSRWERLVGVKSWNVLNYSIDDAQSF